MDAYSAVMNIYRAEPRMLSVSKPDTWDSSPCFSRDGRTLYFASLRKDDNSQGGLDLYSARMDRRGLVMSFFSGT